MSSESDMESTQSVPHNQPPAPKRFKIAPRRAPDTGLVGIAASGGPNNELQNYLIDVETLNEETNAVEYWVSKEPQYKQIGGLAVDLVAAPASQAYVERIFSVCGDFTARKRNKTKTSS